MCVSMCMGMLTHRHKCRRYMYVYVQVHKHTCMCGDQRSSLSFPGNCPPY